MTIPRNSVRIPRNHFRFRGIKKNSGRFPKLFVFLFFLIRKTESLGLWICLFSKWSVDSNSFELIFWWDTSVLPYVQNLTEFNGIDGRNGKFINLEWFLEAVVAGTFGDHLCPRLTSSGSRCTDVFVFFFERNQNGIFSRIKRN